MSRAICSISGKVCKCGTPDSCRLPHRSKAIRYLEKALLAAERELFERGTTGTLSSSKYPLPEIRQALRDIHRAIDTLDKLDAP